MDAEYLRTAGSQHWKFGRPSVSYIRLISEYRENITAILKQAAERNCRVMLVTAPTLFEKDAMPAWSLRFFGDSYLMSSKEIADIPQTHETYNAVIRTIGKEHKNVVSADLARVWNPKESPHRFRRDFIHLSNKGHLDAAMFLFERWKEQIVEN